MINVTKTFLPPQSEYEDLLKQIWETGWITNRGTLVKELENKLKDYLQVPNIIATTNGTVPIQIAIKSLELTGEIITTPFSYVATTSSIVWESCKPVFVDIHADYLTIDETKIENAITSKTSAILATHVFGNPCAVEEIDVIAKKYNLKVIYDAAHCFGVTYKGQSLFNYGDVSTCSFHATKIFHTGEGGCLITKNNDLHKALFRAHNFGHNGPGVYKGVGINAKMSELQAAMGLAVFPYLNKIFAERKRVVEHYYEGFKNCNVQLLKIRGNTTWNYSYFPIIIKDEQRLKQIVKTLEKNNIFTRRYFFPSLNDLPYVNNNAMEISEDISSRILCLPLYIELTAKDIDRIMDLIKPLF